MPHVVAKNEKKVKGKVHLLGTQKGDREELRGGRSCIRDQPAGRTLGIRSPSGGDGLDGVRGAV